MATKKRRTKKRGAPARAVQAARAGPVTLDEAKALAQAPRPARATIRPARAAMRANAIATTPGDVGLERRKRAIAVREENRRRTAEYKATLTIMKKRGVADPKQPVRRRALAAPKIAQPLQVFAEGDSWFDYPESRATCIRSASPLHSQWCRPGTRI
jgi:hypothetical protein